MKHTPGPWHYRTHDGSIGSIDAADGTAVAQAFQVNPISVDLTQASRVANAKLIAAAPELLEALKEALPWIGGLANENRSVQAVYESIRAAIAKAES